MFESKKKRFTIHSHNLDELTNQESPFKKGLKRQGKSTHKRPISKDEPFQTQIQFRSNLLNKERSLNSVLLNNDTECGTVKMSKILLNLPEILHQSMKTDGVDEDQKKEDIVSYSSTKLNIFRDKFAQSVKERYYKKIEVMKEIRTPTISQQIFPISQIASHTNTSITRQTNHAAQPLKHVKNKKSITNMVLQKYQILRQKQDVFIPKQLEAKKYTKIYDLNTIPVQSKNSIRFKFDQILTKEKRSCKKVPVKMKKVQIEGWENDHQVGLQHNFMFD